MVILGLQQLISDWPSISLHSWRECSPEFDIEIHHKFVSSSAATCRRGQLPDWCQCSYRCSSISPSFCWSDWYLKSKVESCCSIKGSLILPLCCFLHFGLLILAFKWAACPTTWPTPLWYSVRAQAASPGAPSSTLQLSVVLSPYPDHLSAKEHLD